MLHVARLLRAGHLSFWFDQTNAGYPMFLAYPPLPTLAVGGVVALTWGWLAPLAVFKTSIVALWTAMPWTWFVGGRWLGLRPVGAAALGLLVLAVHDQSSFGLGPSSLAYIGLYSQSFGTLLLPLALGATYQCVLKDHSGRARWRAGSLLGLTLLCHLYIGYLVVISIPVLIATLAIPSSSASEQTSQRRSLREAAWNGGFVLAAALLLCAWWLGPFLWRLPYQGGLPWKFASENGFGFGEVLRRLVAGEVLDAGRAPWLSMLTLVGLGLAVRAEREPSTNDTGSQRISRRWLMAVGAISFLLWLGPTTWGPGYRHLPFHAEFEVIRYIGGVQLASMFVAAFAVEVIVHGAADIIGRVGGRRLSAGGAAIGLVLCTLVAVPMIPRLLEVNRMLRTFDHREVSFTALSHELASRKGRFLAHRDFGSANHFYLNLLPALAGRAQLVSYGRGYHDTLTRYYVENVELTSVAALSLWNLQQLVVSGTAAGPGDASPLKLAWRDPSRRVYATSEDWGWFDFVSTPFTVRAADFKVMRPLLARTTVTTYAAGVLPRLAVGAARPDEATVSADSDGRFDVSLPGEGLLVGASLDEAAAAIARSVASRAIPDSSTVLLESVAFNAYDATVDATGGGRLLLKVSYDPGWSATVDGAPVPVDHVAPNFMAIDVPAGHHEARFRFRNPWVQQIGAVITLAGWLAWTGWVRRRRRASEGI